MEMRLEKEESRYNANAKWILLLSIEYKSSSFASDVVRLWWLTIVVGCSNFLHTFNFPPQTYQPEAALLTQVLLRF
jgi:hypothetical protein